MVYKQLYTKRNKIEFLSTKGFEEYKEEKEQGGFMNLKYKNTYYLPSGRVFVLETEDGFKIECTEMRDVAVDGKLHADVRNSLDPHVIWKHLIDYKDKWLLTVSTEKGCTHCCKFCDVAKIGYHGSLSTEEIAGQIRFLLNATPYVTETKKAKIGFARMGEPSHNLHNVLTVMKNLDNIAKEMNRNIRWLPCFNSILPRKTREGLTGFDVIDRVLDIKENYFDGLLHFQISVNSTDEQQRRKLFGGANILTVEEIVEYINKHKIKNRTITLNIIVMQGIQIDIDYLEKIGLNGEKFTVKLIPLNNTINAQLNRLKTYANYENYENLVELAEKFESRGIPVIYDAIAKCEEAGLCCGQLVQIFA